MGKRVIVLGFILILAIFLVSADYFGYGSDLSSATTTTWTGNFSNFTGLQDTPSSYTGQSGNCVKVNAGETEIEFGSCATGGNASWNESGANLLYAGIEWDYNQSTATYNTWNEVWLSTYNATYEASVGNASWNQSGANLLYWPLSSGSYNATYDAYTTSNYTNVSNYWDGLNTINTTQMEDNAGTLNLLESWFSTLFDVLFGGKSTDDLTQGSTNLYENASWNESAVTNFMKNNTVGWNLTFSTIYSLDWSNVTITESQIGDFQSYILDSDEGDLNVNSTTWWAEVSGWVDDWLIQTGNDLDFNDSKLSTIYYNATQSVAVVGTIDGGTLADTQHSDGIYDGNTFNISEESGTPGLDIRINFTSITSFNLGVMRYKTSNLLGNFPIIQLWNYDSSIWEDYPPVGESESFATITQPVFDSTDHVSEGIVQMRIYKASIGFASNHYYIDWIAISKGYGTPSGEEIDPYSIHTDAINDTQMNYTSGKLNIRLPWLEGIFISDSDLPLENKTSVSCSNITGATSDLCTLVAGGSNPFDQSLNTTDNVTFQNLTLAQKITFSLGEIIDNVIDGWIKITGGLEVSGAINSSDWSNVTITESQISDLTHTPVTNIAFVNNTNIFTENQTMEGIALASDTTNHRIYDNETCAIITGDTSTLNIC